MPNDRCETNSVFLLTSVCLHYQLLLHGNTMVAECGAQLFITSILKTVTVTAILDYFGIMLAAFAFYLLFSLTVLS